MKNLFISMGIVLAASTSLAAKMECSVSVLTASSSGLMPEEKTVLLKSTQLQEQGNLDLKKCSKNEIADISLTFCALEDAEALGVYMAEMLLEDKNETDKESLNFTSGNVVLATPKKGNLLVGLLSNSALSPVFAKKMNAAGISFPEYRGGDSLQIDMAVENGVKAGAIKVSEIVALSLDSCRLK